MPDTPRSSADDQPLTSQEATFLTRAHDDVRRHTYYPGFPAVFFDSDNPPCTSSECIDQIVNDCRRQFGKQRNAMPRMIAEIERCIRQWENRQSELQKRLSIAQASSLIFHAIAGVFGYVSLPKCTESPQEIEVQLVVLRRIQTLLQMAELEQFKPEKLGPHIDPISLIKADRWSAMHLR